MKKPRKFITVTISGKTVFSVFPANREPDPDFFSLKPSWDQDEHNDIRYSQIGFELSRKHTDTQWESPHLGKQR